MKFGRVPDPPAKIEREPIKSVTYHQEHIRVPATTLYYRLSIYRGQI